MASPKHRLISLAYIQWLATREWDGCYSGFTQTQIDFSCIHTVTGNTRAGRVLQWLHPNTDWFLSCIHTVTSNTKWDGCYSGFTQTQIDFSCIHTVTSNTKWDGCYSGFTQTQIDFSCIHTVTSNKKWDGCYSGFTQTQIDFSCIHTVTSNRRVGRVLQWLHPNTDWFLLHTYSD